MLLKYDLVILCRSVTGNSIADHLVYYGVDMGSDEPSSCRIVMDSYVQNTNIKDSRGNLILSRDPATPLIKLSGEGDNQENPINVDWIGIRYLLHDMFQRFAVWHYSSNFFFLHGPYSWTILLNRLGLEGVCIVLDSCTYAHTCIYN